MKRKQDEIKSKKVEKMETQLLVAGGGTGGIAAAIQAARLGIDVVLVERTSWLGGMLTAAGVSCIDGNYELPSGIFGEFRQRIFDYYGGADKVKTGWVSHVNFEPHVGNNILHDMAKNYSNLTIYKNFIFKNLTLNNNKITEVIFTQKNETTISIKPEIVIDTTEYGDLAAAAGCQYDIGLDNSDHEYETPAIQDITWVAILQKYDDEVDRTIPKPDSYDPAQFDGCCAEVATQKHSCDISAKRMMTYGQLPNNKYMLNWPRQGNDYFTNILEKNEQERHKMWQKAREFTLNMIYFLQNEMGYKNIGLADEFPDNQ
ncbi:MAG TPA: FAD-dependent oxidoreductase, partial [bacterium]|nr:FAD-dependent oxidoreductase [bacterium]